MKEPLDETTLYEQVKQRRGKNAAREIAKIADNAPRHMNSPRAWAWAEARYNAKLKER